MDKLGIEPIQLLTQIFNFSVMVFILTKFLYKPITKTLEERRKKIAEGLKYSQDLKDELEKTDKKRQAVLDDAKKEARKIIEEGKKTGTKQEEEIVANAEKEAREVIEKARKEIDLERKDMEEKMKKEAVEIAGAMTEKILSDILSVSDHQSIIDKKLKEISKLK